MPYQHKPDTGSLFRNEKRETDSHPNARGTALIDGVEWYLDSWTNTASDGSKYQSLKFKRKDAARAPVAPQTPRQRPKDEAYRAGGDDDSDIPF